MALIKTVGPSAKLFFILFPTLASGNALFGDAIEVPEEVCTVAVRPAVHAGECRAAATCRRFEAVGVLSACHTFI